MSTEDQSKRGGGLRALRALLSPTRRSDRRRSSHVVDGSSGGSNRNFSNSSSTSSSPSLSPSSPSWLPPQPEVRTVVRGSDGSLGFYVQTAAESNTLPVLRVLKGSPADGLLRDGDVLLCVDARPVAGFTSADIERILTDVTRGAPSLVLDILPGPVDASLQYYLNSRQTDSTYVVRKIQADIERSLYETTIPCTTRPPRPGEEHRVTYNFMSEETFLTLRAADSFLEWGENEGHFYGTLKLDFLSSRAPGTPKITRRPGGLPPPRPLQEIQHQHQLQQGTLATSDAVTAAAAAQAVAQAAEALGPMPQGWERLLTEEGRPFFLHAASRRTQWMDPRLTNLKSGGNEDLPPGWDRVSDPVLGAYYVDHNNQRTTYSPPTPPQQQQREGDQIAAHVNGDAATVLATATISPAAATAALVRQATTGALLSRPASAPGSSANTPQRRRVKDNVTVLAGATTPGQEELLLCELQRPASGGGLGFTLVGGYPEGVFVGHVAPEGAAAGVLEAGDELVLVNGACVHALTHEDVVTLLQQQQHQKSTTTSTATTATTTALTIVRGPPDPVAQPVPGRGEGLLRHLHVAAERHMDNVRALEASHSFRLSASMAQNTTIARMDRASSAIVGETSSSSSDAQAQALRLIEQQQRMADSRIWLVEQDKAAHLAQARHLQQLRLRLRAGGQATVMAEERALLARAAAELARAQTAESKLVAEYAAEGGQTKINSNGGGGGGGAGGGDHNEIDEAPWLPQRHDVPIKRDTNSSRLGLGIFGGESPSDPVVVSGCTNPGLRAHDGDELLAVDGVDVGGKIHSEVVALLTDRDCITLTLLAHARPAPMYTQPPPVVISQTAMDEDADLVTVLDETYRCALGARLANQRVADLQHALFCRRGGATGDQPDLWQPLSSRTGLRTTKLIYPGVDDMGSDTAL